jgi:hypothetical protein
MSTHPSAVELLQAVIAWLAQPPGEPGREAYMRLVARNALAIVERDLTMGPAAEARDAQRLQALMGICAPLPDLEAELAARLRHGRMALDDAALLAHLRRSSLDRLAIDQPRYRHGLAT